MPAARIPLAFALVALAAPLRADPTPEQAEFMHAAWGMVLGRLKQGVGAATDPDASIATRPPRPKRRRTGRG